MEIHKVTRFNDTFLGTLTAARWRLGPIAHLHPVILVCFTVSTLSLSASRGVSFAATPPLCNIPHCWII